MVSTMVIFGGDSDWCPYLGVFPGDPGTRVPLCPPQVGGSQEGFQGDLEPDLVAVLEAVGDCFFRAVNAEGDSTHLVDLYSFGKSIAREPEEADRRILEMEKEIGKPR